MKCCNCGKAKDLREYLTQDGSGKEPGMVPHSLCPFCLKNPPTNFVTVIDRVCVDDLVYVRKESLWPRFCQRDQWASYYMVPPQLWPGLAQVLPCGTVIQTDGWRVLTKVRVIPVNYAVGKPHYELHWWEPDEYVFIRRGWKHMEETRCARRSPATRCESSKS